MRILIQKFGGTSLTSAEKRERVKQIIYQAKNQNYEVVVVTSAMGRKGDPYATDTLLDLVKVDSLATREKDLLLSCGEIISGTVLTSELQFDGVEATFLTGSQAGIVTDKTYGEARILRVDTLRIENLLANKNVVVVAGFQGISEDGEITTLGRGGSDTSAVALGVALGAEVVEIYTDVDGVKTADPRIVHEARTLKTVTYNEVCQLAHEGAKIIHPRAVEIAMQHNLPLRVKSTFDEGPGTLITQSKKGFENSTLVNERLITGVTHIQDISQLKIICENKFGGASKKIFKNLAKEDISVDFINVTPESVIFTVKDSLAVKAKQIINKLGFIPEIRPHCAKIAVVGAGMTGRPGVMAAIVEALADKGIPILESADSYTTIWCLVSKEHLEQAVQVLHRRFCLDV